MDINAILFILTVRWPFIALLERKNTACANVRSQNVGLAPLLRLLWKRSRQLLPFENEKCMFVYGDLNP